MDFADIIVEQRNIESTEDNIHPNNENNSQVPTYNDHQTHCLGDSGCLSVQIRGTLDGYQNQGYSTDRPVPSTSEGFLPTDSRTDFGEHEARQSNVTKEVRSRPLRQPNIRHLSINNIEDSGIESIEEPHHPSYTYIFRSRR